MALRWDLKRLFPNTSEDTFAGRITRHSAISGGIAFVALIVATWSLKDWRGFVVALAVIAAFNAGEMNVPFEDDEPDNGEPLEGDGYNAQEWVNR